MVQSFENQTNIDISVVLHHEFSQLTDTIIIPANSSIERYFDAGSSARVSEETPFGDVDSVEFITPENIYLHSDILNADNWSVSTDYASGLFGSESDCFHYTFRSQDVWKITRGNVN